MDTSSVLEDVGPRRDRRGRALLGDAERESLVAGFAGSGLTQRAYAERHGVSYNTFVFWLAKWRQAQARPAAGGGFLEVAVEGKAAARLEWVFADGSVVRGAPVDLAILMRELRG